MANSSESTREIDRFKITTFSHLSGITKDFPQNDNCIYGLSSQNGPTKLVVWIFGGQSTSPLLINLIFNNKKPPNPYDLYRLDG